MPPIRAEAPSALLVQLQRPSGEWIDVGILYNQSETNWFESFGSYWSMANRPIIGQIFEDSGPSWRPSARVALPSWFSHLLPEGGLRDAVASAAHVHRAREFNLLARIGVDDLPGALRIGPVTGVDNVKTPPELGEAKKGDEKENPLVKFSLAGAQLKFSIYRGSKGPAIPVKGQAGNAIAKLADSRPGYSGVPEAEFGCLKLAASSGIDAPECRLDRLSSIAGLEEWYGKIDETVLIVDRFDRRDDDRRVHMEELAQILNIPAANETAKYRRANFETIAAVISALCGVEAIGQVIDRMVLNVRKYSEIA